MKHIGITFFAECACGVVLMLPRAFHSQTIRWIAYIVRRETVLWEDSMEIGIREQRVEKPRCVRLLWSQQYNPAMFIEGDALMVKI